MFGFYSKEMQINKLNVKSISHIISHRIEIYPLVGAPVDFFHDNISSITYHTGHCHKIHNHFCTLNPVRFAIQMLAMTNTLFGLFLFRFLRNFARKLPQTHTNLHSLRTRSA